MAQIYSSGHGTGELLGGESSFILTHRLGTRLERLTCRGANMWSCWRQEMAAACTSESEWSWVMAQPTRQDERMVAMVAPVPG